MKTAVILSMALEYFSTYLEVTEEDDKKKNFNWKAESNDHYLLILGRHKSFVLDWLALLRL